jgi:hypothetical protein
MACPAPSRVRGGAPRAEGGSPCGERAALAHAARVAVAARGNAWRPRPRPTATTAAPAAVDAAEDERKPSTALPRRRADGHVCVPAGRAQDAAAGAAHILGAPRRHRRRPQPDRKGGGRQGPVPRADAHADGAAAKLGGLLFGLRPPQDGADDAAGCARRRARASGGGVGSGRSGRAAAGLGEPAAARAAGRGNGASPPRPAAARHPPKLRRRRRPRPPRRAPGRGDARGAHGGGGGRGRRDAADHQPAVGGEDAHADAAHEHQLRAGAAGGGLSACLVVEKGARGGVQPRVVAGGRAVCVTSCAQAWQMGKVVEVLSLPWATCCRQSQRLTPYASPRTSLGLCTVPAPACLQHHAP